MRSGSKLRRSHSGWLLMAAGMAVLGYHARPSFVSRSTPAPSAIGVGLACLLGSALSYILLNGSGGSVNEPSPRASTHSSSASANSSGRPSSARSPRHPSHRQTGYQIGIRNARRGAGDHAGRLRLPPEPRHGEADPRRPTLGTRCNDCPNTDNGSGPLPTTGSRFPPTIPD